MRYNILIADEKARATWLGETLEKIVYTDEVEVVKDEIKAMNKAVGYDKYYAVRIEKDWRGRTVRTTITA